MLRLPTYAEIVRTDEKTCDACPALYEGTLHTGETFYLRYRHGVARFCIEDTGESATRTIPRMADGSLDPDEYEQLLPDLYAEVLLTRALSGRDHP